MSCFTCSVSRVCFLLVATLLLFTEVHCFKNRKLSQGGSIFANTDVFSGFPGFGNFGAAQGGGRATVDEGTASAGGQTATQASGGDDLLDAICTKPSDPTTAEALGQTLAAGKDSAEAVAASKAIAAAEEKCSDSLKTAIARAASTAEASGKGDAFVSAVIPFWIYNFSSQVAVKYLRAWNPGFVVSSGSENDFFTADSNPKRITVIYNTLDRIVDIRQG